MNNALAIRRRAEQTAAALPALLAAARRIAATVQQGVHGRRQPGPGETFWQFRRYQSGDSATLIDWRQSARSEHVYVREREWEAAQSIWLWRDGSPSMDFASPGIKETKKERASLLLLAVAALLLRGGEQVALLGHTRKPARGTAALTPLAETLIADRDAGGIPETTSLPHSAHTVLIGDFLDPIKDITRTIKHMTGGAVTGHLVQVLDPVEETLPYSGRARFAGLEGETQPLIGRVESVRSEYRSRLEAHQAALTATARRVGWNFLRHRTDRPPEQALLALYLALSAQLGRNR